VSSWSATYQSANYARVSNTSVRLDAREGSSQYDYCVSGDALSLRPISDPRIKDVTYILRRVICTPGSMDCTGNVPHTCNADGTGYTDETPCVDGKEACVAGTCLPVVCKPLEQHCNGNVFESCDAQGTTILRTPCAANQYCDGASLPTCQPVVCDPGQGACNGQVSTSCNANGSAFAAGGEDCSAKALACSPGAGCLVATPYDIGSSYSPWHAGTYEKEVGTLVSITTDTRLIEIQSYLSLTTAEHVTFSVYESATLDYAQYPRILLETTSAPAGTGLVSSGPINIMMKTGYNYIITARPDGDFGSAWGYSPALPFGSALNNIDIGGTPSDTIQTSDTSQVITNELDFVRLVTGTAP
jgi:hypothetical protein